MPKVGSKNSYPKSLKSYVNNYNPNFRDDNSFGKWGVLFSIAALLYWFDSDNLKRKRILLLSLAVLTLAIAGGLKGILQVPRPDIAFAPENYPGRSTPSAHAMGSTVIYGGLAVLSDSKLSFRILQYLGAGALIFAIALSRVVLGVH